MPSTPQPSSKLGMFIGSATTQKIPHPASTKFHDEAQESASEEQSTDDQITGTPAAKKRKVTPTIFASSPASPSPKSIRSFLGPARNGTSTLSRSPRSRKIKAERLESNEDDDDDNNDNDAEYKSDEPDRHTRVITTQLETVLPQVQTDADAIEAYESQHAAEVLEAAIKANGNGNDKDDETLEARMTNNSWIRGRSSIYVDAFNLALHTVLEDENHLFDAAEKQVFACWEALSYEAQYLYVRLFLRKTSAWFRVAKLGYYGDIADMGTAVRELQLQIPLPDGEQSAESFPGEHSIPDEAQSLGSSFKFAESSIENITSLDEASSLLLLDELKVIAKDAKIRGKNKSELLKNLRRTSGKQRGLGFLRRSETEDSMNSERSAPLSEDGDVGEEEEEEQEAGTPDGAGTPNHRISNRDEHYTRKILERTGECIRLSLTPLKLFERVHLVFYRSTEWTEKSLTTLVLAKISRRNFPEYIVSRSANIFESRYLLLEFEASLRTQFRVDSILEFNGTPTRAGLEQVRAIFEAVYPRWKTLLIKEQQKEDRVYESGEGAYLRRFSPAWVYTRIVHKALAILAKFKEHLREHSLLSELLGQRLFHAARRGLWYSRKALLEEHYMYALTDSQGRSEEANKKHWKRVALATCEEGLQDNECHVIHHYDLQKRIKKLEKQLRVPKREQHDFGHVGLLKAYERTVEGIKIEADRDGNGSPVPPMLRRRSSALSNRSRSRSQSRERKGVETAAAAQGASSTTTPPAPAPLKRVSTKTIWLDTLDTDEPVRVESMCLSHYRKTLGWKGYHSEGGILRTLFGLLFYDVLFTSYVPNVFQTAYQTCPLDLHTDAFYSARISEINAVINRLANGEAEEMIKQTWNEHYERRTCVVGVRWDEYALDDLVEIARCWKGEALGTVMRVMAQEYASRGGGVPDLFLWRVNQDEESLDRVKIEETSCRSDVQSVSQSQSHTDPVTTSTTTPIPTRNPEAPERENRKDREGYGEVMFSEVKSENDRLSDTQRLWISVLLNAGIRVELCHAAAGEIITHHHHANTATTTTTTTTT